MGLAHSLMDLGHRVEISSYIVSLCSDSTEQIEQLEEILEEGHFDLVVTYNFCPSISIACENSKVKYYALVYDSPLLELYRKEATNSYSYISVFDKKQYERLKFLNRIPHLFYMPLATQADVFGTVNITKKDEKKYQADIAFVGRLYDNRGFNELFDSQSRKQKQEAESIAASGQCIWNGQNTIYGKASEQLITFISSKTDNKMWKIFDMDKRYYCESMKLVRHCNEIERIKILNTLAKTYNVVLYSDKIPNGVLNNVIIRPWVDYWTEMPKVFYLSKINLNITSRSIESGIPQRVWDIMAVGGFVLTNYQPELEDYFEIGKDLEVYHDLEELQRKTEYYLKHEDERIRISINGYKKVCKEHNYQKRLKQVIDYIFK